MYEELIYKHFICHTWHNRVIVEADITLADAIAIVKYVDHGDEFFVVKKVDGSIFKFAWYLNRGFCPAYEDILRNPNRYVGDDKLFVVAPSLYYKEDRNSVASNRIYWLTKHLIDNCQDCHSSSYPEIAFCSYCEDMKKIYDGTYNNYDNCTYGHTYHCDHIREIEDFLKKHNIYTEENIKKLDELKKFWRIDEIDGSAGIKKLNHSSIITGDSIKYIWHKGYVLEKGSFKIREYSETEYPWGDFDRFDLDMDQFV